MPNMYRVSFSEKSTVVRERFYGVEVTAETDEQAFSLAQDLVEGDPEKYLTSDRTTESGVDERVLSGLAFLGTTDRVTLYECDICLYMHPWNWNGDCRDDANRYASTDEYAERHGVSEGSIDVMPMEERLRADGYPIDEEIAERNAEKEG